MGASSLPQHFAAPKDNGGQLIEPPLDAALSLLAANRQRLDDAEYDLQGQSLGSLRALAHAQLLSAARQYTAQYRSVETGVPEGEPPLVLAGHQPELFHPGVWLKNFVLDRMAKQCRAVAVNLIVDSDTIKGSSLRVPTGSFEQPAVENVPFDRVGEVMPFEERSINQQKCFESFGERATAAIRPLVKNPLLHDFWPLAVERSRETRNLGECIAQSRHQWEGQWGLSTLEIPQSRVFSLPAVHHLTAHLLAHLPRFWDAYNTSLVEYRRENRIRSVSHPAPDLATDGEWLEAPYWIWTPSNPRRRRVFVRDTGDGLELTDRGEIRFPLPISPERDAAAGIEALSSLAGRGIRLRSRALLTTLAARVLLGDLFIHGIGGAKYDQLTDRIIARFFGLTPPGYFVVSGTLRLSNSEQLSVAEQLRLAKHELREIQFHPERLLSCDGGSTGDGAACRWASAKQEWIRTEPDVQNARQRCRAIRAANEAMAPWLSERREEVANRIDALRQRLRGERILRSREYAFCLFPAEELGRFLGVQSPVS